LSQRVTVDLDDRLLLIGINRPDKRNAFDLAALEQLSAAYQRLGEDAAARVGVLYAHGPHFSAGLDLAEVGPVVAEHGPEALKGPGRYDPFGLWTEQVPKPVVMAVQGIVLTLSIELALACDIVVAAETSASASWRSAGASCRLAARPSARLRNLAGATRCGSC
jgi:enoyl-CoA hydratase/carnithine racemase